MRKLDLSKRKTTIGDYFLRYMSKLAKEKEINDWIGWFVDMVIFRNNSSVEWVQKELKCSDMIKMYNKLRGAIL